MTSFTRKLGWLALITGVAALIASILCAFSMDTPATPILLFASILLNSAAVRLLRRRKKRGGEPEND